MNATKPLDLAQFEGLVRCPSCDEYAVPEQIIALLSECRRQREEILRLRGVLVNISSAEYGTDTPRMRAIAEKALSL